MRKLLPCCNRPFSPPLTLHPHPTVQNTRAKARSFSESANQTPSPDRQSEFRSTSVGRKRTVPRDSLECHGLALTGVAQFRMWVVEPFVGAAICSIGAFASIQFVTSCRTNTVTQQRRTVFGPRGTPPSAPSSSRPVQEPALSVCFGDVGDIDDGGESFIGDNLRVRHTVGQLRSPVSGLG